MALGNRTETKSEVTSALVPTLTLAQLITLWNDSVNESNLFRKDVIAIATPVGAAVTIDFAAVDTRTVTITVGTTVTFTGLENGDVKYLVISKAATNSVTFAGATDTTEFKLYINNIFTLVPYIVYNKNGVIYVQAIAETLNVTNFGSDIQNNELYKIPNCNAVGLLVNPLYEMHYDVTIPVWDMSATAILNIATPSPLLSNFDRIKGISCTIYDDGRNNAYDISYLPSGSASMGGSVTIGTTNIVLERLSGGFFNSASFNDGVQNRGYLRVFYSTS